MIRRLGLILAVLTGLNLLNYLDRMVISAVLPKIQEELELSNFVGGRLATARPSATWMGGFIEHRWGWRSAFFVAEPRSSRRRPRCSSSSCALMPCGDTAEPVPEPRSRTVVKPALGSVRAQEPA